MEWTYSAYTGINIGISVGLIFIVFAGVCGSFFSSKKGKEFVTDRIIGIDPNKVDDESDVKDANKEKSSKLGETSILGISIFFCFLGALTLSITAVLVFQGCFLANTRLLPNDDCPEYPMDCFVFNDTGPNPINDSVSFHCNPSNKTQFPSGIPDAIAWCFGWIIRLQTTKHVLDQLGVCTGLIGLFTTLLAVIVYLGRCKKTLVLCIIFILCCAVAIILLLFFKWSFAPLTHVVLTLGISLGIFGLLLFCILPKRKKPTEDKQTLVANKNEANVVSESVISSPPSSLPAATSPRRTTVLQRSSKVTPK